VAQTYLPLSTIEVRSGAEHDPSVMGYSVDTFLFDGEFAGFLCRASLDPGQ
jgi:hypothetical protein